MARITQQSSIGTTGTSFENEPIVKSDGASSDVMEWAASTGSSAVKITEDSNNNLNLTVDGVSLSNVGAKIESITSSITVGAVFLYDCRSDSDGGAWRKKCAGLSWYDETLNTATRGGRREFPSVALLVVDNASGAGGITVYDLDDPSLPMFMVFSKSGTSINSQSLCSTDDQISCVYALNGRIYFGTSSGGDYYGLRQCDLTTDTYSIYNYGAGERVSTSSDRNAIHDWAAITANAAKKIVNNTVNDVAATIVEGSEIGALGLPIPTVAVATDGGVSVIHPNGSVYDIASTSHTNNDVRKVFLTDDGMVGYNFEASGSHDRAWAVGLRKIPYADENIQSWDNAANLERYMVKVGGAVSGLTTNTDEYSSSDTQVNAVIPTGKNGLAIGYADRLSIVKRNPANMEEGMVSYHTSDYCTGYMLGDIRFAGLANHWHNDRSVKGNNLTENGSISNAVVATDAELRYYYGFSASNYLSRANDADFDFGTGDFSISLWVKNTNWTGTQRLLGRSQDSNTKRLSIYADGTTLYAYIKDSSTKSASADVLQNNVWQHVFAFRRGSVLYLFVDGKLVNSVAGADSINITPASNGMLVIGSETFDNGSTIESTALVNGSLSLVRISATAPTPTQVADIYEAEKPLFRAGAKCLLESNTVRTMAYDKSTDVLYVSDAGGYLNHFRGLEVVQQDDDSTDTVVREHRPFGSASAAGGIVAQYAVDSPSSISAAALGVSLPAIDVRGDINTADTKSSNDRKIRFTGVTASTATPTVIGHIPLALGDKITVKARVQGHIYQYGSLNGYYEEITATFQRPYDTGTVAVHTSFSNPTHSLSDTTLAGLDVELNANDTAKTCEVKVTGSASYRMQWNATVEVQRISEKTYER